MKQVKQQKIIKGDINQQNIVIAIMIIAVFNVLLHAAINML